MHQVNVFFAFFKSESKEGLEVFFDELKDKLQAMTKDDSLWLMMNQNDSWWLTRWLTFEASLTRCLATTGYFLVSSRIESGETFLAEANRSNVSSNILFLQIWISTCEYWIQTFFFSPCTVAKVYPKSSLGAGSFTDKSSKFIIDFIKTDFRKIYGPWVKVRSSDIFKIFRKIFSKKFSENFFENFLKNFCQKK